ncbi:MAG: tetratricopeptide repeat protein [Verrucomicrobiota bacterium]
MLPFRFSLVVALWLGCLAWASQAKAVDPADLYLQGYLMMLDGRKLERAGELEGALEKMKDASEIFDGIAHDFPEWRRNTIVFRRKRIRDETLDLFDRVAAIRAAARQTEEEPSEPPLIDLERPELEREGPDLAISREMMARIARYEETVGRQDKKIRSLEDDLQFRTNQLELARKRVQEAERDNAALKGRLDRTRLDLQNLQTSAQDEVQELKDQLAAAEARSAQALAALEEGLASLSAELGEERAGELAALRQEHQAEVAALRQAHAQELATVREAHAAETAVFQERVAALEGELTLSRTQMEAALAKSQALANDLSQAQGTIVLLQKEKSRLETQRDEMAMMLNIRSDEEAIAKLTLENGRLLSELAAANERIHILESQERERSRSQEALAQQKDALGEQVEELAATKAELQAELEREAEAKRQALASVMAEGDEAQEAALARAAAEAEALREEELAALRLELATIRKDLLAVTQENAAYDLRVDQLMGELEDTRMALEEASVEIDDTQAQEENRLLRKIILKQLRQQAIRQNQRQLVLEELNRLQIDSKTLIGNVERMAGDPLELSDAEKSLFQENPELLSLAEGGGNALAVVADAKAERADLRKKLRDEAAVQEQLAKFEAAAEDDFSAGRLARAARSYKLILQIVPEDVKAISNLGVIYLKQEKFAEAEIQFKKALVYRDDSAFAHLHLGIALWSQGFLEPAMDAAEVAARLSPRNARVWEALGQMQAEFGNTREAEEAFLEAIHLEPAEPYAHFNLAVLYSQPDLRDREKAGFHYLEAITHGLERDPSLEAFLEQG